MRSSPHGGYCCGISHINGFGTAYLDSYMTQERLDTKNNNNLRTLNSLLEDQNGWRGEAILAEVVLREHQNRVWSNVLLNRGFKLVNSFFNANSGNNLYIYHKAPPTKPHLNTSVRFDDYTQIEELSNSPEVVGDWQRNQQPTPQPTPQPAAPVACVTASG